MQIWVTRACAPHGSGPGSHQPGEDGQLGRPERIHAARKRALSSHDGKSASDRVGRGSCFLILTSVNNDFKKGSFSLALEKNPIQVIVLKLEMTLFTFVGF